MSPVQESYDPGLAIAGLTKLSTCDWPGHLAATVFLQGCPWRCDYCHNPSLQACDVAGSVEWGEVLSLLDRRQGLLDAVVFSGGEPTRQPGLAQAIEQVRAKGFAVGLHTAGIYPSRLAEVMGLVDWVGLDIKALPSGYESITGIGTSAARAYESLDVVVESGVDHEIRITVDPTVHDEDHIWSLVRNLQERGALSIVLQEVRAMGTTDAYALTIAGRTLNDTVSTVPEGVLVRKGNLP